ncbi:MAG TPA: aryl-sulfate sulfotransferase [Candidatus Sulfotelmatobacter sp.]|nr:aryl-sulfate sulfotransferase [Candidatus Sulfotelmatobacter sp.]
MEQLSGTCSPLQSQENTSTNNRSAFDGMLIAVMLAASTLLASCGGPSLSPAAIDVGIAKTQNPLVAELKILSGCSGQAMVEFGPDTTYGRSTSWYPVSAHQMSSIMVAGMRAATTYHMRVQRQCSGANDTAPDKTFTTGPLPSTPPFPVLQVSRAVNTSASASTSENGGIELIDTIDSTANLMQAYFTDRDGNPIWYYDVGPGNSPFAFKPLSSGDILFNIVTPANGDSMLREVDLAGNTIREMDIGILQQKVQAAGYDFFPLGFHHDFYPLPNGHLIILTDSLTTFTDLPGYPGALQVQGDNLIDLDPNWNPVWSWNSFDHLDVNRHLFGLPDWTHANAVVYLPKDGNLLLSMRHQSWILKIDYANGTGSGNVLWRLGYQGDFALAQGDDPSLWFSFQHFPSLVSQNGPLITLAIWDNGDFRPLDTSGTTCLIPGPPVCYSRATLFQVDEGAMVANLVWEDSPGFFSVWGGSVNQLPNGNIEFDSNALLVPPVPNVASEIQEVTQTANPVIIWKMDIPLPMTAYRAYRVPSLYPGVTWQY